MSWFSRIFGGDARDETPNPDEPVVIAYPDGEPIARFWANLLEQRGVRTMLRDATPISRYNLSYMFRPELLVRRADVEEARAILGLNEQGVVPDAPPDPSAQQPVH